MALLPWPNDRVRRSSWSCLFVVACLVVPGVARGATAEPAPSRAGDNTIYLKWSATKAQAVTVTSSQQMVAGQRASLTTGVSDATGRLKMTARFANLSRRTNLSLQGTFVHVVHDEAGNVIKTIEEAVSAVLPPRGNTRATFTYPLDSGWYSMTTSYRSD